jgi:hypothetical protein
VSPRLVPSRSAARPPLLNSALALLLLTAAAGACGEPPEPLPSAPPYETPPPQSAGTAPITADPVTTAPTLPGANPTVPPYAYPTATTPTTRAPTTTTPTTRAPTTVSPTPTPSHAPRCPGAPTGAQILALIDGKPGIPHAALRVRGGPYCTGAWSFTTVEISGRDEDELEPLMVLATGRNATLALVAAGSDVCGDRTQREAPPGIRVLACGF